jgi:hypothetical protein
VRASSARTSIRADAGRDIRACAAPLDLATACGNDRAERQATWGMSGNRGRVLMVTRKRNSAILAMLCATAIAIVIPPAIFVSAFDGKAFTVFEFVWTPIRIAAGSNLGSGLETFSLINRLAASLWLFVVPVALILFMIMFRARSRALNVTLKSVAAVFLLVWAFSFHVVVITPDKGFFLGHGYTATVFGERLRDHMM